jgi:hypothetical protein
MRNIIYSALFLLVAVACSTETHPLPEGTSKLYARLNFKYLDGTSEQSRIFDLTYDSTSNKFLRTAANLQVRGDIVIPSAEYPDLEYGVVEFFAGSITIKGDVRFGNINPNNGDKWVYLRVEKGQRLTVNSSINMNGKFSVHNNGTIESSNVEMQNGENQAFSYGNWYIYGDLQITSEKSTFTNCGLLAVSNYTNFHQGYYVACECGSLITKGLNVNAANRVSGKGSIEVTDNLNLNHNLTQSSDIEFVYCNGDQPKHINQESKLGSAKRMCKASCVKNPMPVKTERLNITGEGDKVKVSFKVLENTNVDVMELQYSKNPVSREWRTIKSYRPEDIKVGEMFEDKVSLSMEK